MKRTKLALKLILGSIGTLLALIIISAALFIYFFPKERLRELIIENAETILQRKMTVENIRYSYNGVILKHITMNNSMEMDSGRLLEVDSINLGFSPASLLDRKLIINNINVYGLKLKISYQDNQFNISQFVMDLKSTISNQKKEETPKEDTGGITTTVKSINLENTLLSLESAPPSLSNFIGNYTFSGKLQLDQKNKIIIHNTRLGFPKNRGTLHGNLIITPLSRDFAITGDGDLDKFQLPWLYRNKNVKTHISSFSGKLNKIQVTRSQVQSSLNGTFITENSKKINFKGFVRVPYAPTEIYASNVAITLENSNCNIQNFHLPLQNYNLKFSIKNFDIDIDDVKPLLTFIPEGLTGTIKGSLEYANKKTNGQVEFSNINFKMRQPVVSNLNTSLTITNNTFSKANIPLQFLGQNAYLSLASTSQAFKQFFANIRMKTFVFPSKQLANSTNNSKTSVPNIYLPITVKGNIDVDSLLINDLKFSNSRLTYIFDKNKLLLPAVHTQFLDADFNGFGELNLAKAKPEVDLQVTFNNLKVQNIAEIREEIKNRFFGLANGKITLSCNVANKEDLLKSLKGTIEASIDRGKLVNTGIQNGLGIWLQPLAHKLKDIEFNTIYGNFSVDGGSYTINSFIFNSPNIRLAINGIINSFPQGNLNINASFHEDLIQDFPTLLTKTYSFLVKNKKGNWYHLTFRDKGNDITNSSNIKLVE